MTKSIFAINESVLKESTSLLGNIKAGDTVKILMKIRETNPDKKSKGSKTHTIQGLVLARKHNKELGASITIRSVVDGVGVEWVLPLYTSDIMKVDVLKSSKVRRAKLYYIRKKSIKETKAKLRKETRAVQKEMAQDKEIIVEAVTKDTPEETK